MTLMVTILYAVASIFSTLTHIVKEGGEEGRVLVTHDNKIIPSLAATIEEHAKVPTDPDLLVLSVPFYIYENEFLKDDSVWNITGMYDLMQYQHLYCHHMNS